MNRAIKLEITIERTTAPSGISITPVGQVMEAMFQEGGQRWTDVKGSVLRLLGTMDKPGESVGGAKITVRSTP